MAPGPDGRQHRLSGANALAQLTDASGVRLPVTSRPLVIVQPRTNKRYVTVGTGRLLHPSDSGSTQAQRFFAIIDGTGGSSTSPPTYPRA